MGESHIWAKEAYHPDPSMTTTAPDSPMSAEQQALLQALTLILQPLATLAVAKGLHYSEVEEQLKQAFVTAARDAILQASPEALEHRLVSRISAATGINRREVTRLSGPSGGDGAPRRSYAIQAFFRWRGMPSYQDEQGQPVVLPRLGPAPSFEALAQSVTKDLHFRSMLDDMVRLGLVMHNTETDHVELMAKTFVPDQDLVKMLSYLGWNCGDHLRAAVDNVTGQEPTHFEQALHATEIDVSHVPAIRDQVREEWRTFQKSIIPALQDGVDAGELAQVKGRVRLGMYMYTVTEDKAGQARGDL